MLRTPYRAPRVRSLPEIPASPASMTPFGAEGRSCQQGGGCVARGVGNRPDAASDRGRYEYLRADARGRVAPVAWRSSAHGRLVAPAGVDVSAVAPDGDVRSPERHDAQFVDVHVVAGKDVDGATRFSENTEILPYDAVRQEVRLAASLYARAHIDRTRGQKRYAAAGGGNDLRGSGRCPRP